MKKTVSWLAGWLVGPLVSINEQTGKRANGQTNKGFTFLELLIAVTIFSIAAVAIYSSFNVGIRAWRKAEASYKIKQEARHALDKIGEDLRNAINFTPIGFEGSSNSVSFARALKIANPKDEYSEGIFKITYSVKTEVKPTEEVKSLCYILQTYPESAKEEGGTESVLGSDISDFKLEYAYLQDDEIVWGDDWKKEDKIIPFGVKVSLFYPSQDEAQPLEFSETVLIPTGILEEVTEGS